MIPMGVRIVLLLNNRTAIDVPKWAISTSLAVAVFIDFSIAGTMCYYLYGSRSDFAR